MRFLTISTQTGFLGGQPPKPPVRSFLGGQPPKPPVFRGVGFLPISETSGRPALVHYAQSGE